MTESNFSEKNKKGVSSFTFPDEPIDVARKLIQATVTAEIPKYDVIQLQEIAEHLLAYCNAQERGCVDACCKDCEP